MKPVNCFYWIVIFTIICASCDNAPNPSPKETPVKGSLDSTISITKSDLFKDEEERIKARRGLIFNPVLDSASRADKPLLLQKLQKAYQLRGLADMKISVCEYSTLYGCPDSIWILELSHPEKSLCKPNGLQKQFIFDATGHLIYEDSAAQVEFVRIWEEKEPLLMALNSNCKGSGQHHFYKYESGQLIDVFNVLLESTPLTYDEQKSDDNAVFKPAILKLSIEDRNGDRRNDLVFSGQRLVLKDAENKVYDESNPYKKEKLEYVFLYERGEDWFVKH